MEKYVKIPTIDSFEIQWILNYKEKSDTLIIFVHGFTGSMSEAHYYCAKEYFIEKWYDVFRFNLYTSVEKTRKLRDCSVKIHSQDILDVAQNFSRYTNIIFVWHSLAGPCLAWVGNFPDNVDKIIFWDPAFDMKPAGESLYSIWERFYRSGSGKEFEVSSEMRKEFLQENYFEVLQNQKIPKENMFAIYADWDVHIDDKPQTDAMWIKSYVIEWANHGFTQEWKYEELFEKTLEFIED